MTHSAASPRRKGSSPPSSPLTRSHALRTRRGRRPRRAFRPRRQGPRPGARARLKTLVVYLMAGRETPALAEAAVAGRRRHHRDRLPVLGSARRRPRHPSGGGATRWQRACARTHASCALPTSRARIDKPIVPMTYASLLEAYGYERFAEMPEPPAPTASSSPTSRSTRTPTCGEFSSWRRRPPTSACGSPPSGRTAGCISSA